MYNDGMPLVSMIIGMYKGENYIEECIESVQKQDYKNLEIILIDDGSPDRCGEIADLYAKNDSRIRVIHQKNSGVSISRNNGLDVAKGEYICIIDQDDIISRDYVSYFYNLIKKNNADIALTPTADKFFEKVKEDNHKDRCEIWSGEQATIEMLYHKVIIAPWNKICLLYTSLLAEVRGCYDYIIIDTPPVGSVIDAAIIAKESDGAVLVIESERVSYKVAQKSMEQLEKTGCKILGAVLNKVNIEKNKYYGKYDYYYKSK